MHSFHLDPDSDILLNAGLDLKGLSHEIDFKNFVQNLKNLAELRDATGV
jgi:hypothetical protein